MNALVHKNGESYEAKIRKFIVATAKKNILCKRNVYFFFFENDQYAVFLKKNDDLLEVDENKNILLSYTLRLVGMIIGFCLRKPFHKKLSVMLFYRSCVGRTTLCWNKTSK